MLHVYYCLKNKCCPGEELVARDAEARIPPKAGKYPVRALHWRDARPLGPAAPTAEAEWPTPIRRRRVRVTVRPTATDSGQTRATRTSNTVSGRANHTRRSSIEPRCACPGSERESVSESSELRERATANPDGVGVWAGGGGAGGGLKAGGGRGGGGATARRTTAHNDTRHNRPAQNSLREPDLCGTRGRDALALRVAPAAQSCIKNVYVFFRAGLWVCVVATSVAPS